VGGYFMGKNGTSTNIGVQTRADGGGNTTYGLMAEVSDYDDTARTGSAYGTWGYVEEFNYNRTGDAVGAYGEAWTEGAGAKRMIGVRGVADEGDESRSGQEYFGGHFEADAYGEATAVGVQGWATGSWNENIGVYGGTDVIGGYGVYGDASSATGYGLYTPDSAYVGYDLTVGDDLIVATGGTLSVDGHAGGVHTRYMVKNWHDVADQGQLWGMAVGNYNSYMRINADNSGILYFHFDVPDNSLVKEVECNFYQRDKPECLTLYLYNGTSQVAGPVTTTTIGAYTTLGFSSDDTLDLTPHTYGLSLRMDVDTAKDGYTYAYVNLYYCRAKYETYDFNY